MKQFDYIIAGAGAAGLTLAYLLMGCKSTKKSTLIIEKDSKATNDRTWCFWEKEENLLENLVYKSWSKGLFKSDSHEKIYDLPPYQYKMIRGIDFYEFMRKELTQHHEIVWLQEEIRDITDTGIVTTDKASYQGNYVFDSTKRLTDFPQPVNTTTLLQHFKGYFLKTDQPVFDESTFTYMDFTIPQNGDFRFGYVLPFSPTEALVEYTIFSTSLLGTSEYTAGVEAYISQLGIEHYQITEEEFGVIPMTDFEFPFKRSNQVYQIGISGGFAKPSTGYTFLRGQKILASMVNNLAGGSPPEYKLPFAQKRFKKYDSTLLRVLAKPDNIGERAFSDMFRKNGMQRMFRFLDEQTKLPEELAVMSSTPLLTFGKAFFESFSKA